ncbi:hypothetical protein BJX64DRAFT_286352 [Aspergillus heterothallicus]
MHLPRLKFPTLSSTRTAFAFWHILTPTKARYQQSMNQAVDTQAIAWEPGVWRRAPWKSFFSIIAFMICIGALVAILFNSNGKAVDSWPRSSMPISVSVLLSLIVGIANVCLTIALNQGYTVSWWLKAMQGAELRRLQFDLGIQHDISALLGRGRTVNKFALAAIISLIVSIIDGPLIQRSSTTILKSFGPDETIVTVQVTNASLPADFSGYAGGGIGPDLLMPLFANVSRAYSNRDAIALRVAGCTTNTTCIFSLPATGFDVSCTESTVEYDFGALAAAGENTIATFNVTLAFGGPEEVDYFSTINTTVLYKPSALCSGNMIRRQCVLRLATVRYNVTSVNGMVTIDTWKLGQNDTVAITKVPSTNYMMGYDTLFTGSVGAGGFKTMLGGIYLIADSLYSSNTTLRLAVMTDVPYILSAVGQAASNYLASSESTYSDCDMTWDDPTEDLVNTIRELMFRSAVAHSAANYSSVIPQQLVAQETRLASAYESNYTFLAVTVAVTVFQTLAIAILLIGWQRLGRDASLDALEIAKALGAPLLQKGSSNSSIKDILARLGNMQLRYGEILPVDGEQHLVSTHQSSATNDRSGQVCTDATSNEEMEMSSFLSAITDGYHPVRRLGLREEGRVGIIRVGALY